jgi:predicted DNA-binding transcriptional regulator AlpA
VNSVGFTAMQMSLTGLIENLLTIFAEPNMAVKNHEAPPSKRLLRKNAARNKLGMSTSSFYAYIKKGIIKPGVPIGPRMKGWPEDEIDAVVQSFIDKRDNQLVGGAQ